MLRIAKSQPVEFFCSIVLIASGLALPFVAAGPITASLGGVLAGAGGILISWSAANVNQAEKAVDLLRPQLETTSRHLGTISSQLRYIVENVDEGVYDSDTGFHLVLQANNTLYGLVNDLQRLLGSQFDPHDLLETAARLDEISEQLLRRPSISSPDIDENEDDRLELREEVKILKDTLNAQLSQISAQSYPKMSVKKTEIVKCINCSKIVNVSLGVNPGDTAVAHCNDCGERFNTHRMTDGSVLRRKQKFGSLTIDTLTEYERIIKNQGIRLVPAKLRNVILVQFAESMSELADRTAPSWDELEEIVFKALTEKGLKTDDYSVKRTRQLLYRTRAFDLIFPDKGIRLKRNIFSETIVTYVNEDLCRRVLNDIEIDSLDIDSMNELLYDDKEKNEEMFTILNRVIAGVPSDGNNNNDSSKIETME